MGLYGGGGGGGQPDPVEVRRAELEKGFQSYKKAMAATEPSVSNMAAVGVVYQPSKTKWKVTKEKTDFKTDFPIEEKKSVNLSLKRKERVEVIPASGRRSERIYIYVRFDYVDGNGKVVQKGKEEKYDGRKKYTGSGRGYKWTGEYEVIPGSGRSNRDPVASQKREAEDDIKIAKKINKVENEYIEKRNKISRDYNEKGAELNAKNTAKNKVYDRVVDGIAKNTKGSDYVDRRTRVEDLKSTLTDSGISGKTANSIISTLKGEYKTFYRTEKLQKWNSKLGAKPPYGSFDASYYSGLSPGANTTWKNALDNDDIDITERYVDKTNFMLYHYTSVGKPAGVRGNKAEVTKQANKYLETAPTDQDLQAVRDLQLGIKDNQTERLLAVPEIAEQWEAARGGDPYWKDLAKQNFLDIEDPDQFAALFRPSRS